MPVLVALWLRDQLVEAAIKVKKHLESDTRAKNTAKCDSEKNNARQEQQQQQQQKQAKGFIVVAIFASHFKMAHTRSASRQQQQQRCVCARVCKCVHTMYICVTYEVCMYVSVYTHCKHGIYSHFGLFYLNELQQYARSMLSHKVDVIETVKSIFKFKNF